MDVGDKYNLSSKKFINSPVCELEIGSTNSKLLLIKEMNQLDTHFPPCALLFPWSRTSCACVLFSVLILSPPLSCH